jgi:diguanylate cyclase (GGDEF)-like protein
MGGDEFVMILDRIDEKDVDEVLTKIRAELAQPYQLDDTMLGLTASIGVACFPEHGETQMALMQKADADMYHAKRITHRLHEE